MLGDDQRQARANDAMVRIRNVYNNTGQIRKFVGVILLIPVIFSTSLIFAFLSTLALINYGLKSNENESKLLAWPKNIIRFILNIMLGLPTAALIIFSAFFILCLYLVNRALITEIYQFLNLTLAMPEEERQAFAHDALNIFAQQTTHDPSAVASVNLSVDKLIEKYKGSLNKEEFYAQLNGENTSDIVEYIKQSNELTEDKKSHALKCLKFINETTGESFQDTHSKLTLKQAAILCWKACQDRNTGMAEQRVPLSNEDIQNRKNMFINGLIDAATTYGNQGQSCAGGTYNKMIESLSGLHPSVIITLDEKEASQMIKETITQKFPETARENLDSLSEEDQQKVQNELPEISPATVNYIAGVYQSNLEQCKKFNSRLKDSEREEVLKECMSNLSYVSLDNQNETSR